MKQRLSMQALQAKKVSPEEVFENMEETLMLLAAEVFQGENQSMMMKHLGDPEVRTFKFQ